LRRALAILLLVAAPGIAACGSSKHKTSLPASGKRQPSQKSAGCKRIAAPKPKPAGVFKRPKAKLNSSKSYELVFDTSCGSFTVALDLKSAPNTAASLVFLAKKHFFDGTTFHRIVPGFVVQGGDPTGTGQGGPGYTTVDRPPASVRYTQGVVAMAKAQTEPAGTAGSQFFVVAGADIGLTADYAVVGKVASGLPVVEAIAQLGSPSSGEAGTPTRPAEIVKVTVRQH